MTPVWGLEAHVVPFVAEMTGERPDFGQCQTLAVMNRDGEMIAGLIFHGWNPERGVMEVSAAATDPRWASRKVLKEAFGYIFGTAGCRMALARTSEENKRVRKLWRAFGADEYLIPQLRGPQTAEAILTVTKERWEQSRLAR
jgi:hypothetical protein